MLTVFFNSRISPLTLTVIFFERSPLAIAVATSAILRTCPVRLPAIKFTLSVKSFHVPATPLTCACTPSLPSVPTSLATLVTSEAKEPSRSTIVLTILAVWRNSPLRGLPSISGAIVCDKSPLATALITRVVSAVGWTKSVINVLTEVTQLNQEPRTLPKEARSETLPSLPTTLPMRCSSAAMRSFWSIISLSVSAIFPAMPVWSMGIRAEKSPFLTAFRVLNNCFKSKLSFSLINCSVAIAIAFRNLYMFCSP